MAKVHAPYGYKANGEPYQRRPNGTAKTPDAPYGVNKRTGEPRKWPPKGHRVSTGGHGNWRKKAEPLMSAVSDMIGEAIPASPGIVSTREAAEMEDMPTPRVIISMRLEYELVDSFDSVKEMVEFIDLLKDTASEQANVMECTVQNLPTMLKA